MAVQPWTTIRPGQAVRDAHRGWVGVVTWVATRTDGPNPVVRVRLEYRSHPRGPGGADWDKNEVVWCVAILDRFDDQGAEVLS